MFWARADVAVDIEIELHDAPRQGKRTMRNMQVLLTAAARKNRLEVSERRLTPEERDEFGRRS